MMEIKNTIFLCIDLQIKETIMLFADLSKTGTNAHLYMCAHICTDHTHTCIFILNYFFLHNSSIWLLTFIIIRQLIRPMFVSRCATWCTRRKPRKVSSSGAWCRRASSSWATLTRPASAAAWWAPAATRTSPNPRNTRHCPKRYNKYIVYFSILSAVFFF